MTRLLETLDAEWLLAGQVWSQCHSLAFDFSVWEIWGALLYGGRLVVVPESVARSPEDFHALLVAEQVSVFEPDPVGVLCVAGADALAPESARQLRCRLWCSAGRRSSRSVCAAGWTAIPARRG